jgi:hypothetical protein
MTLKEKFKNQLDTATPTLNRPFYQAEQCEKIADEFAIRVLEWYFSDEGENLIHDLILVGEVDKNITIKELLKIYKKEKGW